MKQRLNICDIIDPITVYTCRTRNNNNKCRNTSDNTHDYELFITTCTGKINRNYPLTREVTGQGAQLVISVGAQIPKITAQ